MNHRRKIVSREFVSASTFSFNVADAKGRDIGFSYTLHKVFLSEVADDKASCYLMPFPDLVYFEVHTSNARDGKRYGASHPRIVELDEATARRKLEARIKVSRTRAEAPGRRAQAAG